MNLVHDVLDKQLVAAKDGEPMGMADGIVLELRDDQPPRVAAIECGLAVLARQIHPLLERSVRFIGRKIGVRQGRLYRISWSRVESVGTEIKLNLDADTSPATAWERWLRQRILSRIPGGK